MPNQFLDDEAMDLINRFRPVKKNGELGSVSDTIKYLSKINNDPMTKVGQAYADLEARIGTLFNSDNKRRETWHTMVQYMQAMTKQFVNNPSKDERIEKKLSLLFEAVVNDKEAKK